MSRLLSLRYSGVHICRTGGLQNGSGKCMGTLTTATRSSTDLPPRLRKSHAIETSSHDLMKPHNSIKDRFLLDPLAPVGQFRIFDIPEHIRETKEDHQLGTEMVQAWRRDGLIQVTFPPEETALINALQQSRSFFASPHDMKLKMVDSHSYAGYVASGEELTDGIADYSEIFTSTKDLPMTDARVRARWPCHGPTPWPSKAFADAMRGLSDYKAQLSEKILRLTALGLGLENRSAFNSLTRDGWHHLRALRYPAHNDTNGKGKDGRGVGAHTDYGLLVVLSQDQTGGLFIRRPNKSDGLANWKSSSAGAFEDEDAGWVYVPPSQNTFAVFLGDMMQLLTNSYLPSTLHKVRLNAVERYSFAYFHEPNFNATLSTLPDFTSSPSATDTGALGESIHYGRHFTNMFLRNYPERITSKRIHEENRLNILDGLRNNTETLSDIKV